MSATITTNRKTDVRFSLSVKTPSGDAVDLTGFTASVFDVSKKIEGRVTATISDGASGIIDVEIEGTDPIPTGTYEFRIAYEDGDGFSVGLPGPFNLVVR
jgi:hypothetical protein